MRITKTVIAKADITETTIEIDTEAAPYSLPVAFAEDPNEIVIKEPRMPTHQEYEIIYAVLDLPHPDAELTDAQIRGDLVRPLGGINDAHLPQATVNGRPMTALDLVEMYGKSGTNGSLILNQDGARFMCDWDACMGMDQPHKKALHGLPEESAPE